MRSLKNSALRPNKPFHAVAPLERVAKHELNLAAVGGSDNAAEDARALVLLHATEVRVVEEVEEVNSKLQPVAFPE